MKNNDKVKKKPQVEAIRTELNLPETLVFPSNAGNRETVLLIRGTGMGEGDREFGGRLLQGYLRALQEMVDVRGTVILYNEGVMVLQADHPARTTLLSLPRPGLEVMVCQRSLKHYGLEIAPNEEINATTLLDIACRIDEADKVITL